MTTTTKANVDTTAPQLLHPSLSHIPMGIRYGLCGALANVAFMWAYNTAVAHFHHDHHHSDTDADDAVSPTTIYAWTSFLFIPFNHWLLCVLVFGWPDRYLKSLLSNFPIGISSMIVGATCTSLFDQIGLERTIVQSLSMVTTGRAEQRRLQQDNDDEDYGEFYCSMVVLVITGVWSYVLSVLINAKSSDTKKEDGPKKEL